MNVAAIERATRRVVSINFEDFEVKTLTRGWEIVLGPLWEPDDEGGVARRAVLAPRSMRAHYFEGAARAFLEGPDAGRVAFEVMSWLLEDGDRVALLADQLRGLYVDLDAPTRAIDVAWSDGHGVLTHVLADAARKVRVGMTPDEIVASHTAGAHFPATRELERLEQEFIAAGAKAPVEELIAASKTGPWARRPRAR
jgi:hypothetical protein